MNAKRTRNKAWIDLALGDTPTLLRDHAHCERKAAGTALALIASHPHLPDLVTALSEVASEEISHFAEVHGQLRKRNLTLGPDLGDPYARALVEHTRQNNRTTSAAQLADRLLVCLLIEARSQERLRLLAADHPDAELAEIFGRFADAETRHARVFLDLAKNLNTSDFDVRFADLKAFEDQLLRDLPLRCAIH